MVVGFISTCVVYRGSCSHDQKAVADRWFYQNIDYIQQVKDSFLRVLHFLPLNAMIVPL